jgi:hypothetical protein
MTFHRSFRLPRLERKFVLMLRLLYGRSVKNFGTGSRNQ